MDDYTDTISETLEAIRKSPCTDARIAQSNMEAIDEERATRGTNPAPAVLLPIHKAETIARCYGISVEQAIAEGYVK